jgi:chaperone BCS1
MFLTLYSVNDSYLQRAVGSIPKHSILLIEDIDCAFSSREDVEEEEPFSFSYPGYMPGRYGRPVPVTMSGLLNVLDGVGSEEGKLFFATVSSHYLGWEHFLSLYSDKLR